MGSAKKGKSDNVVSIPSLLTHLTLLNVMDELEKYKLKHKRTCEKAARCILQALDCKDAYTFGHSTRVAFYCLQLGKQLGLSEGELYDLELSGLFHDIGKIAVPDEVLLKPARLSEDEFLLMKKHPVKSAEILEGFEDFEEIALNAKHHHERYDGRGYPDGLKGEEIPPYSRMILIADTFDAMTSSRPYRKGLDYKIAFEELDEFAGTQFDPEFVKFFIKAMETDEKKQETTFSLNIIEGMFDKKSA